MGSRLPSKNDDVLTAPTKIDKTDLMVRALVRHVIENGVSGVSHEPFLENEDAEG